MNISRLDSRILVALHGRGHTNAEIALMSPATVFCEFCEWHGLLGWGDTLLSVLMNAQHATSGANARRVEGE